jgi:broad specificity phosphatase PhoE
MGFIPIFLTGLTHVCGVESQLILMRHGQAEHNVQDVYNSHPEASNYTPSHLTVEGESQALKTAQELLSQGFNRDTISYVYVSPLPRVQETAFILVKAGVISEESIVLDDRLTEIQVGELEGLPIIRPWNDALTEQYHTETNEQIFERMSSFSNECLSFKTGKHILVITHAIPAHELMKLAKVEQDKKIGTGQAIVVTLPSK